MSNGPWTDEENDLIVADYFAMLADDIAGRPYNKAEHRRALLPVLNGRSEGSVEFKHQNISAVLKGLGEVNRPALSGCICAPSAAILCITARAVLGAVIWERDR
ncbi:hypothetical protein ABIE58_000643 [Roseovarius sp. MBR-78]|jgi:hypothetical protein